MKQTMRILAVLMMVAVGASSALAVVDPYEVLQVTPAEGQVESLQHFTITFADLPVVVNDKAVPTLQKGGGAYITDYYDLQGHRLTDAPSTGGIYLVKYSDGTVVKVLK